MDDNKAMIPYFAHEGEMVRMERIIKRLWITVLLLIVLLVGTNGAWLYFESQWEYYETTEIDQDGEGVNIVGGGDVSYGTDGNDN